jgi:hypothetical protein
MSRISSKVLLLAPIVTASLMGCGSGADSLAPNDNTRQAQSCRGGGASTHLSVKCAEVSLHTAPGASWSGAPSRG